MALSSTWAVEQPSSSSPHHALPFWILRRVTHLRAQERGKKMAGGGVKGGGGPLRRVGKYEVGRTIGEGTFAKVKFAQNTETGESVAMKVLDRSSILKHKMVDQVRRVLFWFPTSTGFGSIPLLSPSRRLDWVSRSTTWSSSAHAVPPKCPWSGSWTHHLCDF